METALKGGWIPGFCELTGSKVERNEGSTGYCAVVEGIYGDTGESVDKSMQPATLIDFTTCSYGDHSDAKKEGSALLAENHGTFRCWKRKRPRTKLFGFFACGTDSASSDTITTSRDVELCKKEPAVGSWYYALIWYRFFVAYYLFQFSCRFGISIREAD